MSPFDVEFNSFVAKLLADFNVSGLSIAVVDGETFSKGFGTFEGHSAAPETIYPIGSLTKSIFATALVKHFQSENISLQTGFQGMTYEQVLSHTTGMARHDAMYGPDDTSESIYERLKYLSFKPKYQYCNITYMAIPHALGIPVEDMVGSLTRPLGMTSTSVSFACVGPAGCLVSNVLDMAKYIKAWFTFPTELKDEVLRPRAIAYKVPHNNSYAQYALGIERYFYDRVEVFGHNGSSAMFRFVPALNWGFVALGDGATEYVGVVLLYHLLDKKLGIGSQFDYTTRIKDEETFKPLDEVVKEFYATVCLEEIPLDGFAGSYSNPAYRTLTFTSEGKYLRCHAERTWPFVLQLFHASGDYWVVYKFDGDESPGQPVENFRAMSRLAEDGSVEALGLELQPDGNDWKDDLIWFTRDA